MENSSLFNADILNKLSQQSIEAAINGQWQKAVDSNLEVLDKSPENTEALNRLGKAYMELGLIVKSIKTFHKKIQQILSLMNRLPAWYCISSILPFPRRSGLALIR